MSEHADEAERRQHVIRVMGLIVLAGWAAALAATSSGKSSTAAVPLPPPKNAVCTAGKASASGAESAGHLQAEEEEALLAGPALALSIPPGNNERGFQMHGDKPFDITLRWDQHQHTYVAEATDFPGVVGKGHTREEALAAVKDAIRWQAEAATEGSPPAPPQSEREAQRSPK